SAPVRVNDDASPNTQMLPRIALDQSTGFVAATWLDARNDGGNRGPDDTDGRPNDDVEEYGAVSFDGGICFSANIQIATAPSNAVFGGDGLNDFGDYTGLAFDAGTFNCAWPDNSTALARPALRQFEVASAGVTVPDLNEQDQF